VAAFAQRAKSLLPYIACRITGDDESVPNRIPALKIRKPSQVSAPDPVVEDEINEEPEIQAIRTRSNTVMPYLGTETDASMIHWLRSDPSDDEADSENEFNDYDEQVNKSQHKNFSKWNSTATKCMTENEVSWTLPRNSQMSMIAHSHVMDDNIRLSFVPGYSFDVSSFLDTPPFDTSDIEFETPDDLPETSFFVKRVLEGIALTYLYHY
jgi:hypothetical protein